MPQRPPIAYEPPDPTLCRATPSPEELEERLENVDGPFETLGMLEHLAAAWRGRDPKRAQRYARKALRLARSSGDPDAICWTLIGSGRVAAGLQRFDETWRYFDEARSLTAQCSSLACAAQVYHFRGVLGGHLGRTTEAFEDLDSARELAVRSERRDVLGWILMSVEANYRLLGRPADALSIAYEVRAIARDVNDSELLRWSLNALGATAFDLDDFPAAIAFLEESLALAESANDRAFALNCRMNLANVFSLVGRLDEARDMIGLAARDEAAGNWRDRAMLRVFSAGILEQCDEHAESLRVIEEALAIWDREGVPPAIDALAIRARAHVGLGQFDLSIAEHIEAIDEARRRGEVLTECSTLQSLATVLELAERPAEALRYHKEWKALERQISGGEQQRRTAQIRLRAEVEEVERHRAQTLEESEELERRLEARERELATASLQVVEKSKLLDSIVKEMTELTGMIDPSARKSVRALVHRIQSNRESGSYWNRFEQQFERAHAGFTDELARRCPQLTPMELRLCALLKLGMSTKEIADLLATSPDNVEVYRYRVRKKLGIERSMTFPQFFARTIPSD